MDSESTLRRLYVFPDEVHGDSLGINSSGAHQARGKIFTHTQGDCRVRRNLWWAEGRCQTRAYLQMQRDKPVTKLTTGTRKIVAARLTLH